LSGRRAWPSPSSTTDPPRPHHHHRHQPGITSPASPARHHRPGITGPASPARHHRPGITGPASRALSWRDGWPSSTTGPPNAALCDPAMDGWTRTARRRLADAWSSAATDLPRARNPSLRALSAAPWGVSGTTDPARPPIRRAAGRRQRPALSAVLWGPLSHGRTALVDDRPAPARPVVVDDRPAPARPRPAAFIRG
jgi:hypothetical protein